MEMFISSRKYRIKVDSHFWNNELLNVFENKIKMTFLRSLCDILTLLIGRDNGNQWFLNTVLYSVVL